MSDHPPVEFTQVLYRSDKDKTTLFLLVDGQNHYFSITPKQVCTLIESGAEALRKMVNRKSEE